MRARGGQSIVEFALIAPVVILLAMATWDGGSVLRDQVVLQQAARDGARARATAFGGATNAVVQDAVLASAQSDLPSLTVQMITVSPAPDPQSITVSVRYPHALITPVLRQLWGGGSGTVTLQASSTFYVPQLTPTAAAIVPSTPTATPSPTPTLSPTPTPTATPSPTPAATPVPPYVCANTPNTNQQFNALGASRGYWCTLTITSPVYIWGIWQDNNNPTNEIDIYLNTPNPFAGQSEPSSKDPTTITNTNLSASFRPSAGVLWGYSAIPGTSSPTCETAGTYDVYFFNRGAAMGASPALVTTIPCENGFDHGDTGDHGGD